MNRSLIRPLVMTLALATLPSVCLAQEAATAPQPTTAPSDNILIEALPGRTFRVPRDGAATIRGNAMIPARAPAKMEKAAFLGVGVTNPQPALTQQLNLANGVGLVVDFCEPDSPAAKAGLQQHDVIHKLNDQLLINVQQLATLVRTFKPGEEVTLSIFRKGQPQTLRATLVERELPALATLEQALQFNGLSTPQAVRIENDIFQGLPEGTFVPAKRGAIELRSLRDMKPPRIIRVSPGGNSRIVRDDGTHSVHITVAEGKKTLVVTDNEGKKLFDGPFNTDDERSKLPAELRDKVITAEEGVEFEAMPAPEPTTQPKLTLEDVFIGGC